MRNEVCIEAESQARSLYSPRDWTAADRSFQCCRDVDRCSCLGSGTSPSFKHHRCCALLLEERWMKWPLTWLKWSSSIGSMAVELGQARQVRCKVGSIWWMVCAWCNNYCCESNIVAVSRSCSLLFVIIAVASPSPSVLGALALRPED